LQNILSLNTKCTWMVDSSIFSTYWPFSCKLLYHVHIHFRGRRYYEHALCMRRLITQEFQEVFSNVDILLTPTTISDAPLNTEMEKLGPVESCVYDKHTVPINLAG